MLSSLRQLDRILRGDATRLPNLQRGLDVRAGGLSVVALAFSLLYGACMGAFAVVRQWRVPLPEGAVMQFVASAVKVPALFFLTLIVTFPSLYVFNAIVGSRLGLRALLRLLVAAMAVMLAVLASFGTIVVFFSLSTTSYPFMKVLNVVMFAIAGLIGLGFLLQTLHRLSLTEALEPAPSPGADPAAEVPPGEVTEVADDEMGPAVNAGPLSPPDARSVSGNVRTVFRIWIALFALVGAQMSWVLRPFIGNPGEPFTWFRERRSNFFQSVFDAATKLLSGQ